MSTAKRAGKRSSKPKTTKSVTRPSTATKPLNAAGGHKEGSRKGKVHHLFDEQGAEAAWVLGLKLKLKEGTLRSWFAAWKRVQSKGKGDVQTNSGAPAAIKPDSLSATSEDAHP